MIIEKCNRCGKNISYGESHEVTCKHITFWEHDTKRYLCPKCYKKFTKYMKNHYENFFTYLKDEQEKKKFVKCSDCSYYVSDKCACALFGCTTKEHNGCSHGEKEE